jgi:predicted PhzF superfamily epimerase YddE/YHI9
MALKSRQAVDSAVSDKARMRKAYDGREALPRFLFTADGSDRMYSRMFAPDVIGIDEDPATGSGRASSRSSSSTAPTMKSRPGSRSAAA